jgi:hypothetical protein
MANLELTARLSFDGGCSTKIISVYSTGYLAVSAAGKIPLAMAARARRPASLPPS